MNQTPMYLVVDRSNAFSWFSRGVVVPPPLMTKYRDDGMSGRGALPVVGGTSIARMAARARIPVALEIGPDVGIADGASDVGPDGATWLRGALSPRRISAVHVPDEVAAREIGARAYRGFDAAALPIRVSPELFETAEPPVLLEDGAAERTDIVPTDALPALDDQVLTRREAVAGAVQCAGDPALVDAVLNTSSGDPVDDLVSLLHDRGWLDEEDERRLLSSLLEQVHQQTSAGTIVASSVIAALRSSGELEGIRGLPNALDRVEQILRGESEMRRFRGEGQRATKAMLLFLLRPQPEEVTTWGPEDTGADEIVLMLSRLLAGFASRFGGLATNMRAGGVTVDAVLDWMADGLQPNDFAWPERSPIEAERTGDENAPPSLAVQLQGELDTGSEARAVHVAQVMGWTECLRLSVVADTVDVKAQGRRVRAAFPVGAEVVWNIDAAAFVSRLDEVDEAAIASALEGKKPRRRSAGARAKKTAAGAPAGDTAEPV
jgi:hypothetical protein